MRRSIIQHHGNKKKIFCSEELDSALDRYISPNWKSVFFIAALIIMATYMLWVLTNQVRTQETFSCNWEEKKCYTENAKDGVFLTYNLNEISHAEALEKKNCYKKNGRPVCSTTSYTALVLADGSKRQIYECGGLMFKCQPYVAKINNFLSGKEKELVLHDDDLILSFLIGFYCIALFVFIWLIQRILKELQKKTNLK